jgi:hypothetical protein
MLTVQQYAKGATIPQNLLSNAQLTVSIVNEIFSAFPNQFTFNSGYRPPARNAAVGGVVNSFHVQALAADITPLNGNYDKYKSALKALVGKHGWEVIDERNKNHFHLEPSNGKPSSIPNNQENVNYQPQPTFSYQPNTSAVLGQSKSPSGQNNSIAIGLAFLVLVLLLSD